MLMPTEKEILKEIRKIIPNSKKYLSDDCALIEKDLVLTTDTIVENIHFNLKNYTPDQIGWKAMAVNLSDLASMGAKPTYALVSLSLPKKINLKFIKSLYNGIQSCAKKYKTQIIGGNLTSSKEISISITVTGKVKNPALRSNARPGDLVFTTGVFGDAAAGYILTKNHQTTSSHQFISALKTPIPQIELGQKIVKSCARVCLMDASDGLADCLIQISELSKMKVIVDEDKIPISKELKELCKTIKKKPLNLAMYGGEDYQLVGTISKNDYKKVKNLKGLKIIGEVKSGKDALLKQKNSSLVKLDTKEAFSHFA